MGGGIDKRDSSHCIMHSIRRRIPDHIHCSGRSRNATRRSGIRWQSRGRSIYTVDVNRSAGGAARIGKRIRSLVGNGRRAGIWLYQFPLHGGAVRVQTSRTERYLLGRCEPNRHRRRARRDGNTNTRIQVHCSCSGFTLVGVRHSGKGDRGRRIRKFGETRRGIGQHVRAVRCGSHPGANGSPAKLRIRRTTRASNSLLLCWIRS